MFARCFVLVLLTAVALTTGCMSNPTAPPATPDTVRMIRQEIVQADPKAQVGLVVAVESTGRPFAAIGDVATAEFHEGDSVNFIDSNRRPLTTGIVRRIVGDLVHAEWMPPTAKARAPRVGDLAVRYPGQHISPANASPTTGP